MNGLLQIVLFVCLYYFRKRKRQLHIYGTWMKIQCWLKWLFILSILALWKLATKSLPV